MIKIESTYKNNLVAFRDDYISEVLYKYLFEGVDVRKIDSQLLQSSEIETGALTSKILDSFGLISKNSTFDNKGAFSSVSITESITYLYEKASEPFISIATYLLRKYEKINFGHNSSGKTGTNIILYGVPGSGKSNKIKNEYCNDENYMERIVFHPDYTYSDFVGQILPKNESGVINYPFVPGPFTRIMYKAQNDFNNHYYLVIEEINRGNAPAIFGEIFQLLDRNENGVSEYGINNPEIAKAIYGFEDHIIKLPSNVTILATMNTSDQNVFTLDTAFKRRWQMKHIENNIDGCLFADKFIKGTSVTWKDFVTRINEKISDKNINGVFNEDKRLGAYFVTAKELDDSQLFAEKVLLYLWSDAFKYDKTGVFKSDFKSFDEVLGKYKTDYLGVFDFDFTK